MSKIITLAAAASLLALGACNREAETALTIDETTPASIDAGSSRASGSNASTSASTGVRGSTAAHDAGSASETMGPAGSSAASAAGTTTSGVSDVTRDSAQADAEATNLHPKPPGTR